MLNNTPQWLDLGKSDHDLPAGATRAVEYLRAADARAIATSSEEQLLVYRWLVSYAFIAHQNAATGSNHYTYSNGSDSVTMPLLPHTERLAIANNIEGALLGRFGAEAEQGTKNAVLLYQHMLTFSDGRSPALSPVGVDIMTELHNTFLADFLSNGGVIQGVKHDA